MRERLGANPLTLFWASFWMSILGSLVSVMGMPMGMERARSLSWCYFLVSPLVAVAPGGAGALCANVELVGIVDVQLVCLVAAGLGRLYCVPSGHTFSGWCRGSKGVSTWRLP